MLTYLTWRCKTDIAAHVTGFASSRRLIGIREDVMSTPIGCYFCSMMSFVADCTTAVEMTQVFALQPISSSSIEKQGAAERLRRGQVESGSVPLARIEEPLSLRRHHSGNAALRSDSISRLMEPWKSFDDDVSLFGFTDSTIFAGPGSEWDSVPAGDIGQCL